MKIFAELDICTFKVNECPERKHYFEDRIMCSKYHDNNERRRDPLKVKYG